MLKKWNKINWILWGLLFIVLIILISIDPQYIISTPLLFIGYNNGDPGGENDLDPNKNKNNNSSADSKENDALDNLAAIANYNAQALMGKRNNAFDAFNIADEQINKLWEQQTNDNKEKIGADWFSQIKKAQSSADQIKGAAGNSMSGSNFLNFLDLLNRENDSIRTDSLNQQRSNQNDINNQWYESIAANVNARNQLAADTEYGLRNIVSDYAAQATSVAPDKIKERGLFAEGDPGTINQPAWLNPDNYYNNNKVGAASTKQQDWYLEDNAQQKANEKLGKSTAGASAANGNYWQSLLNGYNRRY